ncbi:MAG: pyruvate ferredoxin oxidoreductase [Candidatus Methanomethylophilaceae archaeon]|nr:pyruvate ferredoxin oxidoreductase [Candidatus Methanomethylophilaceae archaeon]
MTHDIAINGDNAVALAWKQIDPDVCAAYPITPQTIIVEKFAEYVANGEVTTEFVCVESEHSALTLCTSSESAGARTFTATASQGLAYMWEMLPITAAMRTPLVMAVANRAISGPININNDHGDAMSARDCGWIMLFSENVQEAYDNSIIAPRIAEHPDVQLPIMVNLDGFILTHAIERMTMVDTNDIRKFVGEFEPIYPLLDTKLPVSHGNMDGPDFYYPHKYQSVMAMEKALEVAEEVFKEFAELTGREYHLIDEYMCDDAEYVAVILGSSYGTMKATVDELREAGMKVGCIMPRVYRPWPEKALAAALAGKKAVVVFDKHLSIGAYGPMFPEVVTAAADLEQLPRMYNVIYGLGGADATVAGFKKTMEDVAAGNADKITYLGVKI